MLGPLQIEKRETGAPLPVEDPNITQFRELVPSAFVHPQLPVYNDPVREAEQREERIKLAWHRSGHGGVYAARQAVDEAAAVHENAVEAYRRTMLRVMTTRNALSNASDQVMGERADRLAQLRVAQGIADVAKFRMEQAGIDLDNAIKELREATAVIP